MHEQQAEDPRIEALVGDGYKELGMPMDAFEAYIRAKNKDGLLALGEHIIGENQGLAIRCFEAAVAPERVLDVVRSTIRSNPDYALVILRDYNGEIPSDLLVSIADQFVVLGRDQEAIPLYEEAGAIEKLVSLGKSHLQNPFGLHSAQNCYSLANQEIPDEELNAYGKLCKEEGHFGPAVEAFKLTDEKDEIRTIAIQVLESGDLAEAEKLFDWLKEEVPSASLVVCGKLFLSQGKTEEAAAVFTQAEHTEYFSAVGDAYRQKKQYDRSIDAYKIANDKDSLLSLAEFLLTKGLLEQAKEAYEAAEKELPRDKVIAIGSKRFKKGWLEGGVQSYKLVNEEPPKEELVACGICLLKKGRLDIAREAFALAKTPMPAKELIECGDMYVQKGDTVKANEAYKEAGRHIPEKEAQLAIAIQHFMEERLDEAMEIFLKLEEFERAGEVVSGYLEKEKPDQALDALKQLGSYATHKLSLEVGKSLLRNGKIDMAREAFGLALRVQAEIEEEVVADAEEA